MHYHSQVYTGKFNETNILHISSGTSLWSKRISSLYIKPVNFLEKLHIIYFKNHEVIFWMWINRETDDMHGEISGSQVDYQQYSTVLLSYSPPRYLSPFLYINFHCQYFFSHKILQVVITPKFFYASIPFFIRYQVQASGFIDYHWMFCDIIQKV